MHALLKSSLSSAALVLLMTGCPSDPAIVTTDATSADTGDVPGTTAGEASTGAPTTGAGDTTGTGTTSSAGMTGTTGTTGTSSAGTTGTSGEPGTSTTGTTTGVTPDTTSTADTSTSTSDDTTGDTGTDDSSTGMCVLGADAQTTETALEDAVQGVLYPSESDYPWVVVTFACAAPVTVDNLKAIIEPVYVPHQNQSTLAERTIEPRTLAQLFDPLTVPQGWWEPDNYARAEQYTAIRKVLTDNLTNVKVFRLGDSNGQILMGAIDVYVIGETADGDLVGMWTVSIET